MPLQGRYKAEVIGNIWDSYLILMDVKETEKSYVFNLIDFQSRYGPTHIEDLFSKSKRVVIRKGKGEHVVRTWSDGTFTIYPFQSGIPFYFVKQATTAVSDRCGGAGSA
ncbi:MAG: hypothetical protein PHY23_00410 [Oscillospiraceae bacterium]|nr:hypothetical protein [Oscillospiraceae bacterium]